MLIYVGIRQPFNSPHLLSFDGVSVEQLINSSRGPAGPSFDFIIIDAVLTRLRELPLHKILTKVREYVIVNPSTATTSQAARPRQGFELDCRSKFPGKVSEYSFT